MNISASSRHLAKCETKQDFVICLSILCKYKKKGMTVQDLNIFKVVESQRGNKHQRVIRAIGNANFRLTISLEFGA